MSFFHPCAYESTWNTSLRYYVQARHLTSQHLVTRLRGFSWGWGKVDLGWGIWTAFRLWEGAFWTLLGLPGGILKLGLQNEPRMGHLNGFLAWARGYLNINGAVWGNVEAWLAKKAISPHSMPPGMFSQERCLLLGNQNSILMTLNVWNLVTSCDWLT